jgi:uncharacterized protein (DUF362 family)
LPGGIIKELVRKCEDNSVDTIDRRKFLKSLAVAGLAATCPQIVGCGKDQTGGEAASDLAARRAAQAAREEIGLVIARGGNDPKALVTEALKRAGGMESFVSRGDVVVVKPNIGWSRTPEQAANTNPGVVEAVVEMCLNAGAAKVKVFDSPCNPARRTYRMSGIEEAVKRVGGDIYYMDDRKFKAMAVPGGEMVKEWVMYTEAFEADVLINVPILKHHSLARLTMGMKNLMGLLGGNRESIHIHFDQKLADINTVIRPDLTIIDAFRILTAHGPNSGGPQDVTLARHIVVATDIIAADAYGTQLFAEVTGQKLAAQDIGYLRVGHEMGLGEIDLAKVAQQVVQLG